MTIFSPQIVGRTDTRKSISLPPAHLELDAPVLREARSAMSRLDMILMRDEIAFFSLIGG
jgi:hypothetical protein